MIEILNHWTRAVLYRSEDLTDVRSAAIAAIGSDADLSGADLSGADLSGADLRGADLSGADLRGADLSDAVLSGADLRGADLSGADLRRADLRRADLRGADLSGADLRRADLSGADLRGADLRDADLSGADLRGADLRDAVLSGADLRGADLRGADLRRADLRRADLRGADLMSIRDDFWAVLASAPKEIAGLRAALVEGRVNGSAYEGECACLVGTIANVRGCDYEELGTLKPAASRPAERFFLAIQKGDKPEDNQCSKLAVEWLDEFVTNMREAFGQAA